jgi:nucleotide-binding universal stress UspA family protein
MIRQILAAIDIRPDELNVPQPELTDNSIKAVLEMVFMAAGGVALLIIMAAGLFYVVSLGNPQSTTKAKNTILYALIGLGVCIFAFTIVRYVIGQL